VAWSARVTCAIGAEPAPYTYAWVASVSSSGTAAWVSQVNASVPVADPSAVTAEVRSPPAS